MPEMSEVTDHLRNVPGQKLIGVTDFEGDGRYTSFVHQKEGPEREQYGNACYLPEEGTLFVHTEEGNIDLGHFLVVGHPEDISIFQEKKSSTPPKIEEIIKVANDHEAIKIMGDTRDTRKMWDCIGNRPDIWEQLDGIKITGSHLHQQYWDVAHRHGVERKTPKQIFTSDGHSVKEILTTRMYAEIPDFDLLREEDPSQAVLDWTKQAVTQLTSDDKVSSSNYVANIAHILMVLWDQGGGPIPSLRGLIPGCNKGDPFHPDYQPGNLEAFSRWFISPLHW
tara:strand:+ start:136 stop:975 length:840 start_codon:yes stop_codon:yes gene_type:complete